MKILGLDLGTNSIGWAVVDVENESNPIEKKGVIIFSEGVKNEKGTEKSRAAERTTYRSARRLKFRRKIRKYQTLLVLAKNNMCPLTLEEVKAWRKTGFKEYPNNEDFLKWLRTDEKGSINPYYFRDKASREKIDKMKLGRAFYHLAQRRGFLSNRLDQSDKGAIEKHQSEIAAIIEDAGNLAELSEHLENYLQQLDINKPLKDLNEGEKKVKTLFNTFTKIIKGKSDTKAAKKELLERLFRKENLGAVKQGISDLSERIEKSGCKTLGQYFWKLYQQNRGLKKNKIRTNYTAREEHYRQEFEIICKIQQLAGIDESKKDPSLRYFGIVKDLYKAIFYQRPLKSQKGLVGKCSFEKTKARCPISRPEYEEYRMYSFINNIKIKTQVDENFQSLNEDERNQTIPKFYRKSKPTFEFKDIKKELGSEHNYNFKDNNTVSGCPTISALINVFGNNWRKAIYKIYPGKEIRNRKTNMVIRSKTEEEVIADIWHVLNTYTSPEKLKEFGVEKLRLSNVEAEKFSKINLKQDYASLSLNAINKILPYLKSGLVYSHAVFMANMQNVVKQEKWNNKSDQRLIELEIEKIIDNHQAENKIQFVINSLLKNCKDNNYYYSIEAESFYCKDLSEAFKNEFGKKTWDEKEDKKAIFSKACESFNKHLKAGTFFTIKRIDEKVIDFLSGKNDSGEIFISDEKQLDKLYHPSDIEKFKPETIENKEGSRFLGLGSPITGSIKNPMAMRTLHQMRKLVNTLILNNVIDERTKINIELARELNDANKRKAIQKWQKDREEQHQIFAAKIKELYDGEIAPTESDIEKFQMVLEQREDSVIVGKDEILKYQLWGEQNHICLYTGKSIGLAEFLGPNPRFDIEHTIPRSVSMDNSKMNKTLCDNKFNREVKKERIPFELENQDEILQRIGHWKKRYEELSDEIERLIRATRGASDKEQKDRLIQKRHYLRMEHDYWKGKYNRFVMVEVKRGFKNSQFVDTGIVTKYAVAYMKSVFDKVYSVKGEMVDQYRKSWGLHEKETDKNGHPKKDNQGLPVYKKKDRSNHIHHCIDAVTIACMNKPQYDQLAHAWGLEEKGDFQNAKKELEQMKPWGKFTEDLKEIQDEVLVVHQTKDILPKQSKKKLRKRGRVIYVLKQQLPDNMKDKKEGKDYFKIIKNGKEFFKVPKYQQGDTVRGSLHQETFYGRINANGELKYVVRKELLKLKSTDVKNIVDDNIRGIIKKAVENKRITFNNNGAKVAEKTIWQNEAKQIPLKKVRVYTPTMKNPLQDFKKHAKPFLSKKDYKQQFNVANDKNYCMAIYEGKDAKGISKREFEIVNNMKAGEYFKLSVQKVLKAYGIHKLGELVPKTKLSRKIELPLKGFIKTGTMVILWEKEPEEIWRLSTEELRKRIYKVAKMNKDGRITLKFHQEARNDEMLRQDYEKLYKTKAPKSLTNGESFVDFVNPFPKLLLSPLKFNMLIEQLDFIISPVGKVFETR